MPVRNIVVLASGRGSNFHALLSAAREERWDIELDARVAALICNRPDAEALQIAHAHGIDTHVVADAAFPDRSEFSTALATAVDRCEPSLVILAGFMRVLAPQFVRRYSGRLINVHPSLLPAFPGLQTHRRALDAGVRVHGATVHFVSEQIDSGPIIAQAAVPVFVDDTEAMLAARVLQQEHRILPRAVRHVLEGRVQCDCSRVKWRNVAADELSLVTT